MQEVTDAGADASLRQHDRPLFRIRSNVTDRYLHYSPLQSCQPVLQAKEKPVY